ncbi:MAG: hypothetical protein GXY25_05665 [Pirellulaceae bacterium]|jgi:hypothetical protein|nr:hypothetical protein [Thermoguttaceae bacterium]MDI9444348.1 hypothetical protein [Planctomycetota bacterium]NLZ00008.1 hypothetical protein [Pirellulaceae bacterium]
MPTQIFALRLEPCRLVAAEVTDEAAATLLDAGEQVLLGTFEELGNLALRLARPLVFIARASAAGSPGREPRADQAPPRRSPQWPGRAAVGLAARSGEAGHGGPAVVHAPARVA